MVDPFLTKAAGRKRSKFQWMQRITYRDTKITVVVLIAPGQTGRNHPVLSLAVDSASGGMLWEAWVAPLLPKKTGMTAYRSDSVVTPDAVLSYVDGNDLLSVIVQHPTPTDVVIHVAGDIDLLTGPSLQDHLSNLLIDQPDSLIIDLRAISFIGATGLAVLLKARKTAARQRTELSLRSPSRRVARMLELLAMDHLFEVAAELG